MKIVIAIIILLVLAIAAIAGQGWFHTGKDPLAAEALPSNPAEITAENLVKLRFSTEVNGYAKAEVDAFLELLRYRLLAEEKSEEIQNPASLPSEYPLIGFSSDPRFRG